MNNENCKKKNNTKYIQQMSRYKRRRIIYDITVFFFFGTTFDDEWRQSKLIELQSFKVNTEKYWTVFLC